MKSNYVVPNNVKKILYLTHSDYLVKFVDLSDPRKNLKAKSLLKFETSNVVYLINNGYEIRVK